MKTKLRNSTNLFDQEEEIEIIAVSDEDQDEDVFVE
jgi:hypothetical protein